MSASSSEPPALTGVWQHPAVQSVGKWASYARSPYVSLRKAGLNALGGSAVWLIQQTSLYTKALAVFGRLVDGPLNGLYYLAWTLVMLNLVEAVVMFVKPPSWTEMRDTVTTLTPLQRSLLAIDPQLSRLVDTISPAKAGIAIPRYRNNAARNPMPLTQHELTTTILSPQPSHRGTLLMTPLRTSYSANEKYTGATSTGLGQTPRHQSPFYTSQTSYNMGETSTRVFGSKTTLPGATPRPETEAETLLQSPSLVTSKDALVNLLMNRDAQDAAATAAQPIWALPAVKPVYQLFQPASVGPMASIQGVIRTGTRDLSYKDPYVVRSQFDVTSKQMDSWILNMRDWLATVVFKPIVQRMERVDHELTEAGLHHLTLDNASLFFPSTYGGGVIPQSMGMNMSTFGNTAPPNLFSNSLSSTSTTGLFGNTAQPAKSGFSFGAYTAPSIFGASTNVNPSTSMLGGKPATTNLFGNTTTTAPTFGAVAPSAAPQTLADLQQKCGNNTTAQERLNLERFVMPFTTTRLSSPQLRYYLLHRIRALASGASLANFRWNSGANRWTWTDAQGTQHTSSWSSEVSMYSIGRNNFNNGDIGIAGGNNGICDNHDNTGNWSQSSRQPPSSTAYGDRSVFTTDSTPNSTHENNSMPTDAEVIMHVFFLWVDSVMPGTGRGLYGTQPFSSRYFLDTDARAEAVGQTSVQVKQRTKGPPHFCLVIDRCYHDVLPQRNNVFETLCLLVHYIKTNCSNYIEMLDVSGRSIRLSAVVST